MDVNSGRPSVPGSLSNTQGTTDKFSSGSQLLSTSLIQDETKMDCDSKPESSDTDWLKVAMDVMIKLDEGGKIDEQEYEKIQRMLREPPEEEPPVEVDDEMFEALDSYYQNEPEPISHPPMFDKSIVEWSNVGYMLEDPLSEASVGHDKSPFSPTSPWSPVAAFGHRLSDFQCPSTSKQEWSLPAVTFAGVSPRQPTGQASMSQPSSCPEPSTSAGPHRPPGIGMSYMYASKASKFNSTNALEDEAIVSSIVSKCRRGRSTPDTATSGSRRKKIRSDVRALHAAEGMDDSETAATREEWDMITAETRERPLALKSYKEALVDLETLLQVFNLSLRMTAYFTVPPRTILEAFQMAYRVNKFKDLQTSYEPTGEQVKALATGLAKVLLGSVPRYEDFPIPYMAGVEVPESWFFNRFRYMGGLDRLRQYTRERKTPWLTPVRYDERRKLRLVYVGRERIASNYAYDWTTRPHSGDPKVSELLKQCYGPPYKPMPDRDTFLAMNVDVLGKYLTKFDAFVAEIRRIQEQQRLQMERLFLDAFEVTACEFRLFLENYKPASGYKRSCRGRILAQWNAYLRDRLMEVFRCLQRVIDIAQSGMLLMIKYSDGWVVKNKEFEAMLKHRIPLFERRVQQA